LAATAIAVTAAGQQVHLQVVEGIAQGSGLGGQGRIVGTAEFLQHPQGLLHPAGVGGHHLGGAAALQLGGVAEAGRSIAGAVARQLVAVVVELSEPLAHVLGAGHQIVAGQAETAPVFDHPQPFPGPIEVGIDQAAHRCRRQGGGHRFGVRWCRLDHTGRPGHWVFFSLVAKRWEPVAKDSGGNDVISSDNPMLVLVSGILLLGGIGLFISWGLTHAYPAT